MELTPIFVKGLRLELDLNVRVDRVSERRLAIGLRINRA